MNRRTVLGRLGVVLLAASVTGTGSAHASHAATTPPAQSTPEPVVVRPEPQGITLADPTFTALPGARAGFGRLGGAVYQIEVPDDWNHQLVLYLHGFEELGPEARVTAPDIRRHLVSRGFAWGASSFSSTSMIPSRAADETAALWDFFARTYGAPTRTYVTGLSMGGMATHIAAERYADRFDGALALCGAAGQSPASSISTDVLVAGAYIAGVDQAQFDAAPDISSLVRDRILPALRDPDRHDQFERILVDLTGGSRPFAREGIHFEEATNWRRAEWLVAAGLAPNREARYRLGPAGAVSSRAFNRAALRFAANEEQLPGYIDGGEITGHLQMPLVTMHTTGDGQVPIEQARILRRRVQSAGRNQLLVQRVLRDPGHCGFTTEEVEVAFDALVRWVEHGVKPKGSRVDDLDASDRRFELTPRPGTRAADAVRGADDRVVVSGRLTLDDARFDARFLGAVVRRNGLVTPCQHTLTSVEKGRYAITVLADTEATGCGAPGAEILLWTFARDMELFALEPRPWPRDDRVRFDASFSTADPEGDARPTTDLAGEVYRRDGRRLRAGTRITALVAGTRCGVASVRRTGSFSGYILAVVGPDSVPGCTTGATVSFRVNGRPALETRVNDLGHSGALDLTVR